jgi:hypothetical protein
MAQNHLFQDIAQVLPELSIVELEALMQQIPQLRRKKCLRFSLKMKRNYW